MRKVAFLTLEERADFCIYDELLFEPLEALSWQAEEIPWTASGVDWKTFDAVIIRSTWDYQNHLDLFLDTMARISRETVLLNSVEICRWNSNKRYLRELSQRGVVTVPTVFLDGLAAGDIARAFDGFAADRLVVKPAVGANADDTFVLNGDRDTWQRALDLFAQRECLVQPFLESILREGEHSLFYFGGALSHAISKQPAAGDFRVQEEHGGLIRLAQPTEALTQAGDHCMKAIDAELLYARVDLVRLADGRQAIIEVELIEPSLYFDQDPGAAARFAQVFDRFMSQRNRS